MRTNFGTTNKFLSPFAKLSELVANTAAGSKTIAGDIIDGGGKGRRKHGEDGDYTEAELHLWIERRKRTREYPCKR